MVTLFRFGCCRNSLTLRDRFPRKIGLCRRDHLSWTLIEIFGKGPAPTAKPMVAVELLDSGVLDACRAIREISSIKAGDETDGKGGVND